MGTGIAQVAAEAGHNVFVYDTRDVALVKAKEKLHATFSKLVEKGKFTQQYAEEVLQRILSEDNLLDFAECGLVGN